MLARGPAAGEVRGRAPKCWGGGGRGVSGALCGPTDKPKPFPAHPVPGLWAAVGQLRLLPLRAEVGFSLMPGGESGPPPCLQGPPIAQLAPPGPGPTPHLRKPPPLLADSAMLPGGLWSLPLPVRRLCWGEGQESAQKPRGGAGGPPCVVRIPSPTPRKTAAGEMGRPGSGRTSSQRPDLTSLVRAVRVLHPRDSGTPRWVLGEKGREVREIRRHGCLIPPTTCSPDPSHQAL